MKKIAQLIGLGLFALVLSSCGFGGCCAGGKTVRVGCENRPATTKQVTKYRMVKRLVDPGPKGGQPYEVTERVAFTETVKVKSSCGICGSIYDPSPGCCDVISPAVLKRATTQGGTGEPHMGTIPTMKILAP